MNQPIKPYQEISMNAHLVVLRHTMDDVPLRLFPTLDEAMTFAEHVQPGDDAMALAVLDSDASTPASVAVYSFAGGVLADVCIVKLLDE